MSFLGNLSSTPKTRVYISVTPGVGLEMIQLDLAGGAVANYAVRDLAYNETSRDIADYEAFKQAVSEMYEELGVNPKCEVVVNMPLVSFGTMQLGLLLPNDAITGAIQSEIEQTYIFRRVEGAIAWQDAPSTSANTPGKETRQILYSAIQQPVVENLSNALTELGSVLVGIETSLTSTLRALEYMGVTSTQMQPNTTWNLMIVNSIGYSLVSLSGRNVVDYYEEPLAIKSFEGDEIYNAINQSAQIALMSYPANYLFIVSDTDQVSASLLASKIQTSSTVDMLENNSFKKQESLIPVSLNVLQSYASKISLQAIGCALADVSDFPLKFNFLTGSLKLTAEPTYTFTVGEQEITLTPSSAMKIVGILAGIIIVIFGGLSYLILPNLISATQNSATEIEDKLAAVDKEISTYDTSNIETAFNVKTEVEKGVQGNRAKLMNYVAAGEAIPKTVWLTYFMTQGNGLVDIKGVSTNVEDVYVFFKNMRDSLIGTKLRLQKLEMETSSVEAAIFGNNSQNYTFEITNMTNDQLNALLQTVTGNNAQPGSEAGAPNASAPANTAAPAADNGTAVPQSGLLSNEPINQ